MSDDIITTGIEADRYLKARQLTHDFETTLLDTLETTGHEMLRSAGYDTDVTFRDKALGPEYTATLATIRTEAPLRHDDAPDANTKLNVGVEWVTPDTIDDAPATDDAYVYVQYKLQHGSQTVYDTVRNATINDDAWPAFRFYDDQWYSPQKHAPGIVAIPLTDPEALNEHLTTLQQHFTNVYAPTQKQR
ncbi:hypothetical protein ACLI4Q_06890 [Natrialbaceae archaeon A-CW1-1]